MRKTLPLIIGALILALNIVFVIALATYGSNNVYGTGKKPLAADAAVIHTVAQTYTTALAKATGDTSQPQARSYGYGTVDYSLGTSICKNSQQGLYYSDARIQKSKTVKISKTLLLQVAQNLKTDLGNGYTLTVKPSGDGDAAQLTIKHNSKAIGLISSGNYTNGIFLNSISTQCYNLDSLPATNTQEINAEP